MINFQSIFLPDFDFITNPLPSESQAQRIVTHIWTPRVLGCSRSRYFVDGVPRDGVQLRDPLEGPRGSLKGPRGPLKGPRVRGSQNLRVELVPACATLRGSTLGSGTGS